MIKVYFGLPRTLLHSGTPPVIHNPQSGRPNWLCEAQLRTQSPLINGGNDCDQSKVGSGECGPDSREERRKRWRDFEGKREDTLARQWDLGMELGKLNESETVKEGERTLRQ